MAVALNKKFILEILFHDKLSSFFTFVFATTLKKFKRTYKLNLQLWTN